MNTQLQTKSDILSAIRENENRIKAFGVKRIGLFGSFVREEQNKESDVDFLVEFEQGKKSFDNFIGLSFFLEDVLNRRIELVTPESLSPYIQPHVAKEIDYVIFSS